MVWPSQIPWLLQDLQRPDTHNEGDPRLSLLSSLYTSRYHNVDDQGAAPNMLRFLICASLLYIGFAFAGWVTSTEHALTFEYI